jgi:phosphoribosylformylglycinamidine synthase I
MRFGVVVFPGSNCDHDCHYVLSEVMGQDTVYIWHQDEDLRGVDCVILPGGFSYGDYLRAGAIARFSPIMAKVKEFAASGGLVLGICNGFQILLESGLLPGAMLRNRNLQFICEYVNVVVERADTPFTLLAEKGQVLRIPIAHMEGNYFADEETLARLKANGQIVFRYSSPTGEVGPEYNPNGSLENIAGICNDKGNVLGMMPHPERCCEAILGSEDGRRIFESIIAHLERVGA